MEMQEGKKPNKIDNIVNGKRQLNTAIDKYPNTIKAIKMQH